MIRIFRHYVPVSLLVCGLIELVLLFASAEVAWQVRSWQIDSAAGAMGARMLELVIYASVTSAIFIAVGLYSHEQYFSLNRSFVTLIVATGICFIVLPLIFFLFPETAFWRSVFLYSSALGLVSVLLFRAIATRLIDWRLLRRRVLVLGAGTRAAALERLAAERSDLHFVITGFIRMAPSETAVASATDRDAVASLAARIDADRVDEIVLAVDERRGAMPLDDLLMARFSGTDVVELAAFLERERGRVDLQALSPGWFIFGDGFGAIKPFGAALKRVVDIAVSLLLLVLTCWLIVITALLVRLTSRGPIFYTQERVGQFGKPYRLIKFRSMRVDAERDGAPQWAQARDTRVTPIGRFIRAARIDEIPQIFNVLKGDMSFVGPRPERPFFVEDLARQIPFYSERHVVKPGITGWAQINYPYGANVDDARHKLEYDLYYVKNYSIFLDILIVMQTVRVVLWQDGVR